MRSAQRSPQFGIGNTGSAVRTPAGYTTCVGITETLLREAVKLARSHGLRAYDSVHLAAVKSIHQLARERVPLRFAVFDTRLQDAARTEGMQVLDVS